MELKSYEIIAVSTKITKELRGQEIFIKGRTAKDTSETMTSRIMEMEP